MRKAGHVALVKPYLLATQPMNIKEVNDALYELYVQEEDHEALAAAVVEYTNFDAIEMAQQCEKHGLLQFRRIGAMLYKLSKKWDKSIAINLTGVFHTVREAARVMKANEANGGRRGGSSRCIMIRFIGDPSLQTALSSFTRLCTAVSTSSV